MSGRFLVLMAAAMVCAGVGVTVVQAADAPAAPAPAVPAAKDATGAWTWQVDGRDGAKRDVTLTLKQDGEKLTGSIAMGGRGGPAEISDGTIKNGEFAFKTVRKVNENEMVTKYSGKIDGDVIKGKSETERNGQTRTVEFEGKRGAPAGK
jgi:hypothetical protein